MLKFFKIIVFVILAYGCQKDDVVKLKVIMTSDIRGAIFPYNLMIDNHRKSSLSQISSYIRQQRDINTHEILLIDNGNIFQGDPLTHFSSEDSSGTHIIADVMNYMKYDAGTIGNLDIELGHEVYDKLNEEFNFPWLAANAIDVNSGKPYFKPYSIFNRKGIKIAVLGTTLPNITYWYSEERWQGMRFDKVIPSIKKWIKIIEEKEKPDIVIGLFHAGIGKYDDNYIHTTRLCRKIAETIPGFDIICAGHDDIKYNTKLKNSLGKEVLVISNKAFAETFTVIDIEIVKSKDGINKNISGKVINSSNYEHDAAFSKRFLKYFRKAEDKVSLKVGEISKSISTHDVFWSDSEFMDLIHNVQLKYSNADISFATPFIHHAHIYKGDIFVRDLFKLYRYNNKLFTIKLKGSEIKNYLEHSARLWFNQMDSEYSEMLLFDNTSGTNSLRNDVYDFDSAEGINYTIDVSKPAGNRIKITGFTNGQKFYLNKYYKVAISSFRYNGGGGHIIAGSKISKENIKLRLISESDIEIRDMIMKWIKEVKIVNPQKNNNWHVIPEKWAEKASAREQKIMFPQINE